jgi:hypothetical protein
MPANIRPSVMTAKRLCACNCGKLVTRQTERRHEDGQGPSLLMSSILAQNKPSIRKTGRKKSSRPSPKQQVIGHRAPVRQALLLVEDPGCNSTAGEDFDDYTCNDFPGNVNDQGFMEANLDLQMGEAGPSGVNNGAPEPSPPPSVPPLSGDADEYGLSNLRRSRRIARHVEQVGLQRWGRDHVQQFVVEESDEEDEEDEEDEVAGDNLVMQEAEVMEDEDFNSDGDFQEDEGEYEMPSAEPGEEGVSVWDLLREGFLKEASRLGESTSIHTFTDV